jgi:hypothetical protein
MLLWCGRFFGLTIDLFVWTSISFWRRVNCLSANSRFKAALRVFCFCDHASTIGRLLRVYRAPFGDELCSLKRRSKSVVMPQYSDASAHRARYTHQIRFSAFTAMQYFSAGGACE